MHQSFIYNKNKNLYISYGFPTSFLIFSIELISSFFYFIPRLMTLENILGTLKVTRGIVM